MLKESITALAIVAGLVATSAQARDGEQDRGAQREARFAQMDANGDGQLTAEEIVARSAARFAAADSDGDGAITLDEMKAQARSNDRFMARFDADKDGTLSAEELAKAEDSRMGKRAAKHFERMDADNSGGITLEEMQARRDPAEMVAKLDADNSGAVSLEEFANARGHGKGHGQGKNRMERDAD
jgi:Ca2+-binding EF-hand superfamily protein